jgi:hypothetical protein
MLILVAMLLIGSLAAIWGFTMCFLPTQWHKIMGAASFSGRWTEPSAKRSHPLIRFGNCVAGFVIFAVGSWFAYVAGSEIYLALVRRPVSQVPQAREALPNSSTVPVTVLSVFMLVSGVLIAVFPAKALTVFETVWPVGRSLRPQAAPKAMLFLRVFGGFLVILAMMSLMH